jgi:PAS domain S-box-containing protein
VTIGDDDVAHGNGERRDTEARSLAWDGQFRRFIEAAPDAIGVMRDGQFLYVNPRMVAMLGHDHPDDLIGRSVFDCVCPEEHERFRLRSEALLAGETPPTSSYRMVRRDGTEVVVECTAITVEFQGGVAILGIGRDVTERERLQARMIASQRMASLGVLTAGIAHEINNPLTYLSLNLAVLERLVPAARRDPRRLDDIELRLAEVRDAAERVSAIVRDLSAFARPPEGDRTLVDFGEVVHSGLKLVRNELHHRAVVDLDIGDTPPVVADAGRLVQVVVALITNALQALPDSPGDEPPRVRVQTCTEDAGAILTVTDSGPGVSPSIAARIFEPFFTTKPVGEGTGLGLSVVHGIVRRLGGTVTFASRPGETTFRIWLPAAGVETAPSPGDPLPPPQLTGLKILVIDDEELIGAAMQAALPAGQEVEVVTSTEEALDRALSGHHDLILCDLMMPGMTGMDLFEQVKRRAPERARRFVFMTGGAFTRRASEFLAEGDLPCIAKPFDLDELSRVLHRVRP